MKTENVTPDSLKRFLGKPVRIILNRGRRVCGTLKGFDNQMNVNLFNTVEERKESGQLTIEEVGVVTIRGSSIIHVEVLEKVDPDLASNIDILEKEDPVSLPQKEGELVLADNLNLTCSSSEDNPAIEMDVSTMETAAEVGPE